MVLRALCWCSHLYVVSYIEQGLVCVTEYSLKLGYKGHRLREVPQGMPVATSGTWRETCILRNWCFLPTAATWGSLIVSPAPAEPSDGWQFDYKLRRDPEPDPPSHVCCLTLLSFRVICYSATATWYIIGNLFTVIHPPLSFWLFSNSRVCEFLAENNSHHGHLTPDPFLSYGAKFELLIASVSKSVCGKLNLNLVFPLNSILFSLDFPSWL